MPFLTRDEAARQLRVSTSTLDNLTRRGDGPPIVRISGRIFFDDADLRRWIAEQRRPQPMQVTA